MEPSIEVNQPNGVHMPYDFSVQEVAATRIADVRATHARRLWESGWGRGRFMTFQQYLASIPSVPRQPLDRRFTMLVLVDAAVKLTHACQMLGIAYQGDDTVFSVHGDAPRTPEVYWLWVHDGASNRGRAAFDVRHGSAANERGLTALEGVCLYACHPDVLTSHSIDLVAARLGSFPAYNACLLLHEGQPTLGVSEYCVGGADRGAPTCMW